MRTRYVNGNVYTSDDRNPWVDSFVVDADMFAAVGDGSAEMGADAEVDLGGRFAMPGMYDLHVHPDLMLEPKYMGQIQTLPLGPADLAQALTEWDAADPGDSWIFGGTWFEPGFDAERVSPGAAWLDNVIPHRPVALLDAARHVLMANTLAMRAAGLDASTFEPDHGKIYRDEAGNPTGVFADGAQSLLSHVLPQAGWSEMMSVYREGEETLRSLGFVGARSVHVNTPRLQGLQALHRSQQPTVRWQMAISWKNDLFFAVPDRAALMTGERHRYRSRHVNANLVKFHLDGTGGSKTAFMLEPYVNDPSTHGELNESPEETADLLVDLDRQGITAVIHVIGDRAARVALDGIEAARQANGDNGPRHTLAHCNFLHKDDIRRMRELNVVGEFSHTTLSPQYAEIVNDVMSRWHPPTTMERFLDIAGAFEAGVTATLGSDWVVMDTPNVFGSLVELLTRRHTPGDPITIQQAVKALTVNGAFAFGLEESCGSIRQGNLADFIVLDRDITSVAPDDIGQTKVLHTVFEGITVHEA